MPKRVHWIALCLHVLWITGLCLVNLARGATVTWDGGSGANSNWGTDDNWNTDLDVPINDNLVFTGGVRLTNRVEGVGIIRQYGTITFDPNAQGSFLIGGGVLTNNADIVNNSSFLVQFTNTVHVISATGVSTLSAISNSLSFTGTWTMTAPSQVSLVAGPGFTNSILGDITGSSGMKLTGGGLAILGGANGGYSGVVSNQGATLVLSSSTALGTGNYVINSSASSTRYESANQTYIQTMVLASGAATNEVASGVTVVWGNGNNDITGSGQFVKTGAGTFVMTNTVNNYTGGTLIKAGTLELTKDSVGTGTLTLDGGTLLTRANVNLSNNVFIASSSTLRGTNGSDFVLSGNASFTGNAGTILTFAEDVPTGNKTSLKFAGSNSWTYNGGIDFVDNAVRIIYLQTNSTSIIAGNITGVGKGTLDSGNSGINVGGSGSTLILRGNNSFTGSVTVDGGTLILESDNALGAANARTAITNSGTIGFQSNVTYTATETILMSDKGNSGNGTLVNLSGTNSFAGNLTAVNETMIGTWAGKLTISGTVNNGGNHLNITNAGTSFLTNSGVISGTGATTKRGSGTWVLSAANTMSGNVTNLGGTIESRAQSGLGTGSLILNGGNITIDGVHQTNAQAVTLNSGATWTVGTSVTNTLTGAVTGTGSLTKSGAGVLVLQSAANTFSGALTNLAGSIESRAQGGLGTGSLILNGGNLSVAGVHQTNAQAVTLASGANWKVDTSITNTLTGAMTGTGSLTKSGAGVLILQGDNNFTTGVITNSAGTLMANSVNAIKGVNTVAVDSGTLLFNFAQTNTSTNIRLTGGSIQQNDVNVSLGALTLVANSTIDFAKDGSDGRFQFTTATNISGQTLTITGWSGDQSGGDGDLIFFTNSTEVTASFLSHVTFSGYYSTATLIAGGQLVPITPEPGTLMGGNMLLFLLAWMRRRFRSVKR